MHSLIVLGAGSQAKVVIDLLSDSTEFEPVACLEIGLDDTRVGGNILNVPIEGTINDLHGIAEKHGCRQCALAIGDNAKRQQLFENAEAAGLMLATLVHPSAVVSNHARIGDGTVISAQAFVGPDAVLGRGCIINTASSVDHDCCLGDFVHVAVGVRLPGTVNVGDRVTFGAGSCAIPGIHICSDVTVGAGAAVISDITEAKTVKGVPAR